MVYLARRYAGFFDGVDDYVDCGEIFNTTFTVFVRFKVRNDGGAHVIVSKHELSSGEYGWKIGTYWGDGIEVKASVNGYLWEGFVETDIFSDGEIVDIIAVYDIPNKIIKVYKGSELLGTASLSDSALNNSEAPFRIGTDGSFWYNDDIHVVMYWNRVLDESEIEKLAEDPLDSKNIPQNGLLHWWDFNKADWDNGILPDLVGNNNGTIYGVHKKSILIKRGNGNIDGYGFLWSWVVDGVDDGVDVEYDSQNLISGLSYNIWARTYSGDYYYRYVKDVADVIGHYDSSEGAWRIDAGENGYYFEEVIDIDDYKMGRWLGISSHLIKVDDNSSDVDLMRIELIDYYTGEVIFSGVAKANEFSTNSYKNKYFGEVLIPRGGKLIVRVYSYGNVGYYHKDVYILGWYCSLLYDGSSQFLTRYGNRVMFRLYYDDGTWTTLYVTNVYEMNKIEMISVKWDKNAKRLVAYKDGVLKSSSTYDDVKSLKLSTTNIMHVGYFDAAKRYRYNGEIFSIMLYDRPLSDDEVQRLYNKELIINGLIHWWVVDKDGYLVDLVTGKKFEIQGNPRIRKVDISEFGFENGKLFVDLIVDERGD